MRLSTVVVCMLGAWVARADVYYDFETAATSPVWLGTTQMIQNTSASHQGTNAIALTGGPYAAPYILTELPQGTTNVEFYFYDEYGPNPPLYQYMFFQLLEATNWTGFAGFSMLDGGWGTTPPMTENHYYAWGGNEQCGGNVSPIQCSGNNMGPIRTIGWHKFTFAIGPGSVAMSLDDTLVLQTNMIRTARYLKLSLTDATPGWGRMDDLSISTGTGPCVTPPPGLVGWWPGEGNANDIISGNNGNLTNGAAFASGEVGQAFSFNTNHAGVLIGNTTNLQLQNFTIEAWIRRGSTSFVTSDPTVIYANANLMGYGSQGYSLGIFPNGTLLLTKVDVDYVSSGPGMTDTNFHHVAVTKSETSVIFYVDGSAYPVAAPYSSTFQFTTPAAIGGRGDTLNTNNNASFFGTIDEISIYNRALSGVEIAAIYNAGSAGKCGLPPVILAPPRSQMVLVGANVTFGVTAAGTTPLSYQWQFAGTDILNATNSSFTIPSASLSDAGNYSVFVTNALGTAVSSNAVLTVNPPPPCVTPPPGLIAWWPGNGNASDIAGSNNGTLVGGATYASGEAGQAFSLDGSSGYVQIPDNDLWAFGTNGFTIELWANWNAGPGGGTFVSNDEGGGQYARKWIFSLVGSLLEFTVNNPQVSTVFLVQAPFTPSLNQWYHIAIVRSGNVFTMFVNGVTVGSETNGVSIPNVNAPLTIGQAEGGDFNGELDEVSIYSRALGPGEISAIYNAGSAGKCRLPHAATANAVLAYGFFVAASVSDGGFGYTNTPTVKIIGGGGSGAQAVAEVSNGVVMAINVLNAGYGYTNAPLVVIEPPFIPNPVLGIAPMSFLSFSNLTLGGVYQLQQSVAWYWSNQPVSFTATNPLYAQMVAGVAGSGDYRLALSPVPAQAFATPQVVNGFVVGATVTSGGSGYVTAPAVTIVADGGGSNATAVSHISGGVVMNIAITDAGIGYTNTPTVVIAQPPAAAVSPTVLPVMRVDSTNLSPYDNYQIQFKPDLSGAWSNWNGGSFSPTDVTNSQYLFITNSVGVFRLQYVP